MTFHKESDPPPAGIKPITYYGWGHGAMPDELVERMKTHPDEFYTNTCGRTNLIEDSRRFGLEMNDWFVSAHPPQEWNETFKIKVEGEWSSWMSQIHVTINDHVILHIMKHKDGTFGVHRWEHEPALHCTKTYLEAADWARQYCFRAVENLNSLLWVCEFARFATTPSNRGPRYPLADTAAKILAEIRGVFHQSELTKEHQAHLDKFWADEEQKHETPKPARCGFWRSVLDGLGITTPPPAPPSTPHPQS